MKQVELHRHLDVSVRHSTLLELAQKKGIESSNTSLDHFKKKIVIDKPMKDLAEVLANFSLFPKLLDRPEILERVAFEVVEDCYNEGTDGVELRYSPNFLCEVSKLSWDVALESLEKGIQRALKKYPNMSAGLICIAARDYGSDSIEQAVEFFLKHQKRFIGFDLAGNEADYPCRLFEAPFRKLRKANARITIHAGEAAGPENIWEAVELLGAQRIGHGIACVKDLKLMDHLAKHRICLEICPTSNYLTNIVRKLEDHPLPRILRSGVPVSINTDDPSVFETTLPGEIEICRNRMKLTSQEIDLCLDHSRKCSFLLQRT